MQRWFIVLVFLIVTTVPAQAVINWNNTGTPAIDGFEYTSQAAFEAAWDTSCPGNPALLGPTTDYAHTGTRSIRDVHNLGVNSCFIDRLHSASDHIFVRFWLKHDTGFDWETPCAPATSCSGGTGAKIIYFKSDTFTFYWFTLPGTHGLRGAILNPFDMNCPPGSPHAVDTECFLYPNAGTAPITTVSSGQCIELEMDRGTPGASNGLARGWVDGTLVVQYTSLQVAGATAGGSHFNHTTYYDQAGNGIRHIDDLQIAEARIGCGAAAPADPTPPANPSGLRLN